MKIQKKNNNNKLKNKLKKLIIIMRNKIKRSTQMIRIFKESHFIKNQAEVLQEKNIKKQI